MSQSDDTPVHAIDQDEDTPAGCATATSAA